MKLIRFGPKDKERPGVIVDERRIAVSEAFHDFDEQFFGNSGLTELADWIKHHAAHAPEIDPEERLGPCVARPSKIVCIGLNYADHARESGAELPSEPILFFKSTTALSGPYDPLVIPHGSRKTDWEVELAVVIGRTARDISIDDATDYIAGYAVHNDYSEREWQLERGGQWVKGKSADTFAPIGPFLATPDEINDVHELPLWLSVNGVGRQKSSTKELIFGIPYLISYISRFMTLLPGDVISTGTPPGVGLGQDPPVFIQPGDVIECGIEGIGSQSQRAVYQP